VIGIAHGWNHAPWPMFSSWVYSAEIAAKLSVFAMAWGKIMVSNSLKLKANESEMQFSIQGASCGSCVQKIEKAAQTVLAS
jgi:hypothetical protein